MIIVMDQPINQQVAPLQLGNANEKQNAARKKNLEKARLAKMKKALEMEWRERQAMEMEQRLIALAAQGNPKVIAQDSPTLVDVTQAEHTVIDGANGNEIQGNGENETAQSEYNIDSLAQSVFSFVKYIIILILFYLIYISRLPHFLVILLAQVYGRATITFNGLWDYLLSWETIGKDKANKNGNNLTQEDRDALRRELLYKDIHLYR